jgi:O-antigen/teichoic acid export membrane protein
MFEKILKSEYIKNSFILILGTGLAQLIPVALQPFLRRMYDDNEFGVFAQFYSLVSILSIVANLRFSNSIVIPKNDREALGILYGSIWLNTFFSILIWIVLAFFGTTIYAYLGLSQELNQYTWILPLSVFLVATNFAFNFWLTRKKKFIGIALNKGARRVSEGGAQLSLRYLMSKGGLIIGTLVGDLFNLLMFLFQFKKSDGSFKRTSIKVVLTSLRKQKEFPKYSLIPSLLNVVSTDMPVFLIAAMYSKAIVGQYDGSRQLLAIPLALISVSLSQVLYQRIVELNHENKPILPLIRQNFFVLFSMAIVGILIMFPFGVEIHTFIFGNNWELAGEMSSVLVFSYAIKFIISPLSISFIALKKLKISAIWQALYFVCIFSLIWIENVQVLDFMYYLVLIDLAAYLIYGALIWLTLYKHDRELIANVNPN